MEKWKVINSEVIFENKWITLNKDRCVTGRGIEIPDYYWYNERDFIVIFGVTDDLKVVMVEQYRHGAKKNTTELPAGLIEDNEDIIDTAKRELLEETGYAADEIEFQRVIYIDAGKTDKKGHVFFAKGLKKVNSQQLDQNEDITVKLVDFNDLDKLVDDVNEAGGISVILLALRNREWFLK